MKLDIEKEARTWIKDSYPLMNADDFNDCGELDVYDMISFAKHINNKPERHQETPKNNTMTNMGIVIEAQPYKTWLKRWKHKLFGCPTFWKSKWNTLYKSKPMYRCPECKRAMHCYWDGNDTKKGIDYCDKCAL